MGRRPRQASDTGYYHVVTRGNRREAIFHQADDYAAYCDVARAASEASDVRLAHFCLTPNHTHLLAWAAALQQLSQKVGAVLNSIGSLAQRQRYASNSAIRRHYLGRHRFSLFRTAPFFLIMRMMPMHFTPKTATACR